MTYSLLPGFTGSSCLFRAHKFQTSLIFRLDISCWVEFFSEWSSSVDSGTFPSAASLLRAFLHSLLACTEWLLRGSTGVPRPMSSVYGHRLVSKRPRKTTSSARRSEILYQYQGASGGTDRANYPWKKPH